MAGGSSDEPATAPRHDAPDHPGADGGRAGQRAGGRGVERGRPRLAAVRDAQPRRDAQGARGDPARRPTSRSTSTSSATRRRRRAPSARPRGGPRSRRTTRSSGSTRTPFPPGRGRAPFSAEAADVLERVQARRRELSLRPARRPELLARVRAWGAKILSSATTVDEARWLEAHGVDAIIAQGLEAGGHRGMFLSDDLTHAGRHVRAACRRSCRR